MKKRYRKYLFRTVLGICCAPFLLFLLASVLIYLPPVQRWAVSLATDYLSEETGMTVTIKEVALRFPIDINLSGVSVEEQDHVKVDTADVATQERFTAYIGDVLCSVRALPLLDMRVEIDMFLLKDAELDTSSMIPDCRVKGKIRHAMLCSGSVNLVKDSIILSKIKVKSCQLDVCLSDTAEQDTTTTETPWCVVLHNISAENAKVNLAMLHDSLRINTACNISIHEADLDLRNERYRISDATLRNSSVAYHMLSEGVEAKGKGIDFNNLSLSAINGKVSAVEYWGERMRAKVDAFSFKERSGLTLKEMQGEVALEGPMLSLHDVVIATPTSRLSATVETDIEELGKGRTGYIEARSDILIGKDDILLLSGDALPKSIRHMLEPEAVSVKARLHGDADCCTIDTFDLRIPKILKGNIQGEVCHIMNTDSMTAATRFLLSAAGGTAGGSARFSAHKETYNLTADIKGLDIRRILPTLGIGKVGGLVEIDGRGFDVFNPRTQLTASVKTSELKYSQWDLAGAEAMLRLEKGRIHASLTSQNEVVDGSIGLDALLSRKLFSSTFSAELRNIDFYALRMTRRPLQIGVCGHIDVETDMVHRASIVANLSDIRIQDSTHVYHPDDIDIDAFTARDTTHAVMTCGDFDLRANARQGVTKLTNLLTVLGDEMTRQFHSQMIDATAYRKLLPDAKIFLTSGSENPVARLLSRFGYDFSRLYTDLSLSPETGINGCLAMDTLKIGNMQLDAINMDVTSDADSLEYMGKIKNGKRNKIPFEATMSGQFRKNSLTTSLVLLDKDSKKAIDVAMHAAMEPEGIVAGFDDRGQILGYKTFMPNTGNYVRIGEGTRIFSNLKLLADDKTGFQIYTNDSNEEALQDVTFSVYNLDLAGVISVVPYMPLITGTMSGDVHVEMTKENTTISSSIATKNLVYENSKIGNLSTEIVYMPQDDGTHYLDGILYKDEKEIANIQGTYQFGDTDQIDAEMTLDKFPVDIVNGFIPDKIIGFDGAASGTLSVQGMVDRPIVNGELDLGSASVLSIPYGVRLKADDDRIKIVNSCIMLENYALYDSRKQPITVSGSVDFSHIDEIFTDLKVIGKNILIIDAKETKYSEAYGKAFVNFYASITGEVESLRVRSHLDVLPSTNLYYILKDSPLTTDNRLKELVTFTNFNEKQQAVEPLPTVEGINLSLSIAVKEGAHVVCWLNTSHSNYLDIVGSGDLRFLYRNDEMSLTGRYTISSGEMKYSLPVIPLKTFEISPDSYVDFTGDIFNPRLNITATEKMKTTISDDGMSRSVLFECGVVITKTLQDMGLQFIIDAPEDQTISDELGTMSVEEKGKVAVTMLTTGLYLSERSSSDITMNSALSSFLQNEINNIAGSALRTMDLSVGMESTTNIDGTMSTDYAFRFAKRFWNNRVSVSIGGRIATGAKTAGRSQSFFDNVEMQYRLSDTSNQYLRLFYNTNVYDYLEGYLDQYGAGYLWKKKMQRLKEIFSSSQMILTPRRTPSDTLRSTTTKLQGQ